MKCYRIMSEKYYQNPYSVSGTAGRWNPKGARIIYAGSSPSVALLEYLCIMGTAVGNNRWHVIVFDITDEKLIGTLEATSLPRDWNMLPHGKATQDFGKLWLAESAHPFLRVPSGRLNVRFYPLECNVLINPDFRNVEKHLKVVDSVPFSYLLNKR